MKTSQNLWSAPIFKATLFAFFGLTLMNVEASSASHRDTEAQGVEVHLDRPVECTYHFIRLSDEDYVVLDVIRSDKGNSVRFFRIRNGGLAQNFVRKENAPLEMFRLLPTGDRLLGTSAELSFDVKFEVLQSASQYPPEIGEGFSTLVAIDHPKSQYSGWVRFRGEMIQIPNGAIGSISQHFGEAMPPYAYFNTLRKEGADQHFVGAIVQGEAFGKKFLSGYVVKSEGKKLKRFDVTNSKLNFSSMSEDPSHWSFIVKPLFGGDPKIHLNISSSAQNKLDHELDGAPTSTYFGSEVQDSLTGQMFEAVLEYRDFAGLLSSGRLR